MPFHLFTPRVPPSKSTEISEDFAPKAQVRTFPAIPSISEAFLLLNFDPKANSNKIRACPVCKFNKRAIYTDQTVKTEEMSSLKACTSIRWSDKTVKRGSSPNAKLDQHIHNIIIMSDVYRPKWISQPSKLDCIWAPGSSLLIQCYGSQILRGKAIKSKNWTPKQQQRSGSSVASELDQTVGGSIWSISPP